MTRDRPSVEVRALERTQLSSAKLDNLHMNTKPRPLHWYRGEQDAGNTVCGKGTNRTSWTDREDIWNAPENAPYRCPACVANK